ncbi:MAG: hypothetical protein HC877_23400 [Thioploca sp.]|nr:hypothetical protein [Thioploca sp.]
MGKIIQFPKAKKVVTSNIAVSRNILNRANFFIGPASTAKEYLIFAKNHVHFVNKAVLLACYILENLQENSQLVIVKQDGKREVISKWIRMNKDV